jgi:hypothetical protein
VAWPHTGNRAVDLFEEADPVATEILIVQGCLTLGRDSFHDQK